MVDELEKSAIKLAQSEREEAWREMAKQVARNQNPLT
jgi:nitrogen fixation/metabolism regulation signal transduction histidine kinase